MKMCLSLRSMAPLMLILATMQMAQGLNIVASEGSSSRANPIRRVVTMLQSMAKKIEEEGKTEEELYSRYMCYCKTSGAGLQEGIAAAEAKVPQVQSALEEAKSKKAQLDTEVKGHQEGRDAAFHAIGEAEALRHKENGDFSAEEAEYKANIAALEGAIGAIKSGMVGSFLQQAKNVGTLQAVLLQAESLSSVERDMLASFLQAGSNYGPQSGEILGILEQLKEDMEKTLAHIQGVEHGAVKNMEEMMGAKGHELIAHTLAIEEKVKRAGELGVQIAEMAKDASDTQESLDEDKQFYADMEKNCAAKTAEWQSIEKLRAEELTAIHETIKILNDDDALDLFKATLPSPSLMQVSAGARAVQKRALGLVVAAKGSTIANQRPGLDLIALALSGKKVSFDKVMKMIDTLIATLGKEQQDDDHHKEYCEKQFDDAEDKKKVLEQEVKDLSIAMDEADSLLASLAEEIKSIADGIKALDKDVAESTETRKEEHEAHVSLMTSDAAAKELLGIAKNRLQKFYNPALYKPPPKRVLTEEERVFTNYGGTLAPTPAPGGIANTGVLALVQLHNHKRAGDAPAPPPESFSPYAKKAEMSNGVLKMLDMLVADLDKEMQEAEVEEKNAQSAYESFIADAAAKRASDSKSLTDKESAKAEAEAELQAAKEGKTMKASEVMAAEEFIAELHGSCDWLLKNFDLRKSARAGEVDSLKSAKAVLAGADYS